MVVDQSATIGALRVAVARAYGHHVAYLPGLAMRLIADLYPGTAKTEATQLSNRIRGLLTGIHPALERAIGRRPRARRT